MMQRMIAMGSGGGEEVEISLNGYYVSDNYNTSSSATATKTGKGIVLFTVGNTYVDPRSSISLVFKKNGTTITPTLVQDNGTNSMNRLYKYEDDIQENDIYSLAISGVSSNYARQVATISIVN